MSESGGALPVADAFAKIRDAHAKQAEELLELGDKWADRHGHPAAAHASLALYYQARIDALASGTDASSPEGET